MRLSPSDARMPAEWLRGLPYEFWRERAPSEWTQVDALNVGLETPLELWDLKFDLTFMDDPKTRECRVNAKWAEGRVRRWARELASLANSHLLVAHVVAATDLERRAHVHGVLSFTPTTGITDELALAAWRDQGYPNGRNSVVQRYDERKGAIQYAISHGGVPTPQVACLPWSRCWKKRCGVSPYPWRTSEATLLPGRAAARRLGI